MCAVLLVHGGDELAQRSFVNDGHADWAQAVPLALEKHGFLDFDCVSRREVRDFSELDGYAGVVVADAGRLVGDGDDLIADLARRRVPTLLEGPVPASLHPALGIRSAEPLPQVFSVTAGGELAARARRYGSPVGGRVVTSRSKPLDRDPELDWRAELPRSITERQAEVWRAPGWRAERVTVDPSATVLAEMFVSSNGSRFPAVVAAREMTACSFGLLAYIGQAHTSEPHQGSEWRSMTRVSGLETLLLALIDRLHEQAKQTRTRILPWPDGSKWALNVRHDFDRPLPSAQVRHILGEHERAGTRATWYWRARHAVAPGRRQGRFRVGAARAARMVARKPGHEVALHTERIYHDGVKEREQLERAIGGRVVGSSAHGDPSCFRYQGAPNVLWAEEQGFLYTELIQHSHLHPHRFACLRSDGTIRPLDIVCLPHHESFDSGTAVGETRSAEVAVAQERAAQTNALLQVMNHPDLHAEELFTLLRSFPSEERLNLTADEIARWWRSTHISGSVDTSDGAPGAMRLHPVDDVRGLHVEFLEPDGRTSSAVFDCHAGERVRLVR